LQPVRRRPPGRGRRRLDWEARSQYPRGSLCEVGACGVTIGPRLGQCGGDDGVDLDGERSWSRNHARWWFVEMSESDLRERSSPRERRLPGETLEEHTAEPVDVDTAVEVLISQQIRLDLLRGHVVGRPD